MLRRWEILNWIEVRNKSRQKLIHKIINDPAYKPDPDELNLRIGILISESLDNFIESRIRADKTLEGILKDIQGNIASIAENGIAIDKREK